MRCFNEKITLFSLLISIICFKFAIEIKNRDVTMTKKRKSKNDETNNEKIEFRTRNYGYE